MLVGAGNVAVRKLETLLAAGARVDVVAPQALPAIQDLANAGAITLHLREFAPSDVVGHFLVVACTDQPQVDAAVFAACEQHQTLCTAADRPESCSAWWLAVRQRGDVQLCVGTAGNAPGLAGRIADEAMAALPKCLDRAVQHYAQLRDHLRQHPELAADYLERGALLARLRRLPWRTLATAKSTKLAQIALNKPVK